MNGLSPQPKVWKLRVALGSTWPEGRPAFTSNGVLFSSGIPLEEADGVVALQDPHQDLLDFPGPRLWVTGEPSWHSHYHRDPIGRRLMKELPLTDRAWYAHPDPACRIPHMTTYGDFGRHRAGPVREAAVTCASNYGGRLWFLRGHLKLRNRFVTSPLVDLYGSPAAWNRFRAWPAIWRQGPPPSYRGAAPGSHDSADYLEFLSRHKVCVCLENYAEPYYFTEKFVNAVRAGCIPVYHAHPTVRETFLGNAEWVDPADFDFDPEATLKHALGLDHLKIQQRNDAWLDSGILTETTASGYYEKIISIFKSKWKI